MAGVPIVAVILAVTLRTVSSLRERSINKDIRTYSFEQFVKDFGRSYVVGSSEYKRRASIFAESLLQVREKEARNRQEGRSWAPGVHPFMDWTQSERASLHGYKPPRRQQAVAAIQLNYHAGSHSNMSWGWGEQDWSDAGATEYGDKAVALRDQGNCGSCWAISAVEAVEAQLARNGNSNVKVSAQALVDCVPNPQHCGGTGGCDGATGELAYTFMREHGIPLEDGLPYTANTDSCPMKSLQGSYPAPTRVKVDGWKTMPSNTQQPLMQALVQDGPAVVAVDGNNWMDYRTGVFDSCDRDATLGHAVLARGYGEENGRKYWLIQNSWGASWGEAGHIRLLRHDSEEEYCGTDRKPQEGMGCDGGPSEVRVCGMCGVLYDQIIPQGVRIESDSQSDSAQAPASFDAPSTASFDSAPVQAPVATAPDAQASDAAAVATTDAAPAKPTSSLMSMSSAEDVMSSDVRPADSSVQAGSDAIASLFDADAVQKPTETEQPSSDGRFSSLLETPASSSESRASYDAMLSGTDLIDGYLKR